MAVQPRKKEKEKKNQLFHGSQIIYTAHAQSTI